ncbi:hypothetical protein APHCRT_0254 [Anaplasma phagocytophilum str. CRT53-1]|uniref:Uncharacterized protein n=1 Tax=Anaplasma phagocytophilum str. CRT53-1 TaxID=1359157 RepID=A0A0F3Q6D9_ANAPH|nr:hypothetical protein APHCRT_0254 [Anaplasma phagocytophilum str. CRT53-1]
MEVRLLRDIGANARTVYLTSAYAEIIKLILNLEYTYACAMCYVLCAMCYVLCAMCYVLCAMCYVLCAH